LLVEISAACSNQGHTAPALYTIVTHPLVYLSVDALPAPSLCLPACADELRTVPDAGVQDQLVLRPLGRGPGPLGGHHQLWPLTRAHGGWGATYVLGAEPDPCCGKWG
jgi:hypothetical protein